MKERPEPNLPEVPEHSLIRRIGRGSSGEVWLASDSLGNWRAVKLVFPDPESGDATIRRELEGLRRYEPVSRSHPSLLPILFIGTDATTGALYYVMELADDAGDARGPSSPSQLHSGEANAVQRSPISPEAYIPDTLSRRIRASMETVDPSLKRLDSDAVLAIAEHLALGLERLHGAGLVHRDLKPGNVVFVRGLPRLADCGLVGLAGSARSFVGTEGFLPPEGPGSPSADIYALGKVIYEAAFGMDRNDWPELPAWLGTAHDIPRLRGILDVIRRACVRDVEKRYRGVSELIRDLRRVSEGKPVALNWWERRRTLTRVAVFGGAVALAASISLSKWFQDGWASLSPFRSRFAVERLPIRPDDYAGLLPILGDRTRNELHFFAARESNLLLLGRSGERLGIWPLGESQASDIRLLLNADVNGDGNEDGVFGWRDGTNIHLSAVSQYPREFNRFTVANRRVLEARSPRELTHFRPMAVIPGIQGRRRQMVTVLMDEPTSSRPDLVPRRSIISFSATEGHRLWETPIAGGQSAHLVTLLGETKGVTFLYGGYSPSNGVRVQQTVHPPMGPAAPIMLDDEHVYLHAMDSEGRLVWVHELGDFFVNCHPFVLPGHPVHHVYAWVWANDDARSQHEKGEVGRIHCFDLAGRSVRTYDRGRAILDRLVTDLEGDGQPEILITDSDGKVTILDPELRRTREVPLVKRRHKRVELRWVGEADLDRNGRAEFVVSSVQVEPRQIDNFGKGDGGGKFWGFHEAEILILDRQLKILDRHRITETAERNPCEFLHLSDQNPERHWEIVRQGPQVEVIRWR